MHFINQSTWNSSQHYGTVANIIVPVMAPSTRMLFTSVTYHT